VGDRGQERLCPWEVWGGEELDWVRGHARLYLRGVGWRYTAGWPFDEAHERILRDYRPPRRYRLGLFLPCSYGKPYSQSYIHYLIRRAIAPWLRAGWVHEIILTNAGVVPRELEEHWPYVAYDWNPRYETPEVKECYRRVLAGRIEEYIRAHGDYYDGFAAYLRWDSDSWAALREAASRLGLDIENLAPQEVPGEEVVEAGLGLGYDSDEDIILVTGGALEALRRGLERILGSPGA
jgi:hypothetical protein